MSDIAVGLALLAVVCGLAGLWGLALGVLLAAVAFAALGARR